MNIAELLDAASLTRTHRRITIVIGLGLFFDLFDVFLSGVLGSVLTKSFGLSQTSLPLVLGSGFLGMFFGSTFMGAVADRIGRRPAFLLNLAVYSLFSLAGAFSPSASFLIVTRFVAGLGIGAQLPLSDVYLSEVLPARSRGHMLSVAYTIGFCGIPAIGLSSRVLVPLTFLSLEGWRWLFVAGSLGGVIIVALQNFVVESPRWLAFAGRMNEARETVALLTGQPAASLPAVTPAPKKPMPSYLALFKPDIRGRVLMLYVFQFFQTVGYYGFGTMVPLVLAHKGFSILQSLTYTTVTFLGYPLGSALSLLFIEKLDRRWIIMLSAAGMAASGLALGYSETPVLIAIFGVLYTLISNVFSNGLHTLQGEIFPTEIRGRAAGSAYGLSRLSSALMPFVLLPALTRYGAGVMFAIIAAAMVVCIADIGLFAPKTTGRKLEQIVAEA